MSYRKMNVALSALFIVNLLVFLSRPLHADSRPMASSLVHYLPMPTEGEWHKVHVAPGGQEIFIPDALARIAVIDVATNSQPTAYDYSAKRTIYYRHGLYACGTAVRYM